MRSGEVYKPLLILHLLAGLRRLTDSMDFFHNLIVVPELLPSKYSWFCLGGSSQANKNSHRIALKHPRWLFCFYSSFVTSQTITIITTSVPRTPLIPWLLA